MDNTQRLNAPVSMQIARMGEIAFTNGKFSLPGELGFNIKNDSDEPVSVEVRLDMMSEGETITTTFEPGWNPEIVKEVIQPSGTVDLKWGM